MEIVITLIRFISLGLTFIVLADIIVSYFLSEYHPIRRSLDSIVQPLLAPIRRIVPPIGMLDFSPVVLIFVIILIENILIRLLS